MALEIIITFIVIAVGIFLFVREVFSIDTTAILIMTAFIVTGILEPMEGFSGFNHPATITVGSMFVVSAAIFKTGILNGFGRLLIWSGKQHKLLSLFFIITLSGLLSAFINDTAVVAMFLPVVIKVAHDSGIAPGRLLMPLSFGALLGGVCTLIGTSTNILVSGIVQQHGLEPLGMFEFSGPAIWITLAGMAYMLTLGAWLIPNRKGEQTKNLSEGLQRFLTEIQLHPESEDFGKPLIETSLVKKYKARVVQVKRSGEKFTARPGTQIIHGDSLRILVSPEKLTEMSHDEMILMHPEKDDFKKEQLETGEEKIYEVIVPQGSYLQGQSFAEFRLNRNYPITMLGMKSRRGRGEYEDIDNQIIKAGSSLLILGSEKTVEQMQTRGVLIPVSDYEPSKKLDVKNAIIAILITAGIITTAALNITSIVISAMVGVVLLIVANVIKPEEAYRAVEWKVIFMLAGVLSMGTALEKTGGAEYLGHLIQDGLGGLDPRYTMSFLFLITFMATNIMSNNASAALLTPIAISVAHAMELSERPFVIAVMLAASLAFMTPMGYQTNTMIYTPGNYRFTDYLRVGTPLNIIVWIVATIVIPMYFPFEK